MQDAFKQQERRRLNVEGYGLLTDSDVEDLYDDDRRGVLLEQVTKAPYRRIRALSVFGGPLLDEQGKVFPNKWDYWCQHCCHPFDTAPFGIPMKYDDLRNRFYCVGRFCSDSCMKAVMIEKGYALGPIGWNVATMLRKAYGRGWDHRTVAAPVRSRLKQFGGDLDIEAFRAYSDRYVCWHVPNNVLIELEQLAEMQVTHQREHRLRRNQKIEKIHQVAVAPHVKNVRKRRPERVRIAREKPLPKKTHTLESFMRIS